MILSQKSPESQRILVPTTPYFLPYTKIRKNVVPHILEPRVMVHKRSLKALELLFLFFLSCFPRTFGYAGHPDGIMRGNRPLNLANTKHNNHMSLDERSKSGGAPSRLMYGIHSTNTARNRQSTPQATSYFEEMWGAKNVSCFWLAFRFDNAYGRHFGRLISPYSVWSRLSLLSNQFRNQSPD